MRHGLFPLHTILYPGSRLPLQIFEQRYIQLITECMREQHGFVTVLIRDGKEVGDAPIIYQTGCYVEIRDFETLPNGLLGITIEARYRVRLFASRVRDSGLLTAESRRFETDPAEDDPPALPQDYRHLVATLKQLMAHPFAEQICAEVDFDDAYSVCYRLCDLLPLDVEQKQLLLEVPTLEELLDQICIQIKRLQK